mgnify:CR=1 FL=1
MTTLIKNARAIVTVDDADRVLWNANILVDGCEIKYIGTENMEADRVIDASGLLVLPGITGLWQVSGRSDLSWEDSVRLDLSYVENWSITNDLLIAAKTIRTVAAGSGAY